MKLARFRYKKKVYWGKIQDGFIRLIDGDPFKRIKLTNQRISLSKVKLLPPAGPGGKIILTGLNYRDHARELKMRLPREPVVFLKPNTSLIADQEKIIYPPFVNRLDYEAELAVVIKRQGRFIRKHQAGKYILGFTCLNDVTARDLQRKDVQWTRAKSFDTFCPLGPWIETKLSLSNLKIRSYLNGQLKQDSSTAKFIFSVDYLIWFISRIMTLHPGDIISTGTPSGTGSMRRGDLVEIELEGLGRLKNRVI
ncbi:fumarylacetoacetate hydrolase family protein [Candidatus Omnitrophota bacterium]